MSLTIKHARRAGELWADLAVGAIAEIASSATTTHACQIWLTQRSQRDRLLELAARRGCRGWLNPPIHFLSSLPDLFAIEQKPIGLLARRHLIAELAGGHARTAGIRLEATEGASARAHMLDGLFGELLPEGVAAEQLERVLGEHATDDEFSARRNAWIVASYRNYLAVLDSSGTYDPRQVHALVAGRINDGMLRTALDQAERLHVVGLHSTRTRRLLLHALAEQNDVAVTVHTTGDAAEWREFDARLADDVVALPEPAVQPAPDVNSEMMWVAGRVKELLQAGGAEAHDIAIVARTGIDDTRRALHALQSAGIPATARVRTRLSEIGALKAVLELFRAAAQSWSYRALRSVLANPYFGQRVDLRPFDRIAGDARPAALAEWSAGLQQLLEAVRAESGATDRRVNRLGLFPDRLERDVQRFQEMRNLLARLDGEKPLPEWIALARAVLQDNWFRIRRRICNAPAGRLDIVRLDQRGVRQFEALLSEWQANAPADTMLTPDAWLRMLRSLLEQQELVLTTPGQKGVQVLEAQDVTAAHFRATFLVHANDGEFPRSGTTGGLFSEEERARLRAAGLPIDDRAAAQRRERALWHSVVGSADHVHVSYRTTDPRGTPLLPSLLVARHNSASELPRSTELPGAPLNPEQARRRDAVWLGEQLMLGATPHAWPATDPDSLRHALLNAHAEQLRGAPDRRQLGQALTPWNGQLRDPYVLDRLADRFGPEYPWSASQLQLYAECPFFFLLQRVLRFEEREEAEEETSILTIGGVAHDVLQRFYDEARVNLPPTLNDQAAALFTRVAHDVFTEREASREWLGSPVIWRQKKLHILELLHAFLKWDLDKMFQNQEVPHSCERELGGSDVPLYLTGRDVRGQSVIMRLTGRIDRIDRDRRGNYLIIDYKTSSTPSPAEYMDGAVLQGPLYAEAMRQDGEGLAVTRALYRSLKKRSNGAEIERTDAKFQAALSAAFSIPARVLAGHFEVQLAKSAKKWKDYQPGLAVRRSQAQLESGTRFDG